MNSKVIKSIGAGVLAAGLAFAYAETAPPQHRAANRQEWSARRFDRMSTQLNLTDAQKTQAKAILKEAHESAMKFAPQMKQNRQALAEATKAGNNADIERLANEQGSLMGKMIAVRTEAFAKIYHTLTPEQRAKADQFRSRMHQRIENHHRG